MEVEEGVTEAEGWIPEPKARNMEAEGEITEVDGRIMESDLEEATEAEGGVTEPHLKEATDREGGVMEAKEVAREMECVAGHNIVHQYEASGSYAQLSMFQVKGVKLNIGTGMHV
ncbi:hypothetical protein R1flu_019199 [Riccia fluitans]|uniref:Uncharacterized protein n=1 Tax=Riccia fluitans TaxID=41844 RepID=A0ABD1ZJJ3_9MARC